jgi:hypothetical protein
MFGQRGRQLLKRGGPAGDAAPRADHARLIFGK